MAVTETVDFESSLCLQSIAFTFETIVLVHATDLVLISRAAFGGL
jgi:hypothetical protein